MDVLKNLISLKLTSKETLFPPNFDSRLVNADWLITGQVKSDVRLCKLGGAVDGLLNKCIRRYFFSLSGQRSKKIIIITPDLR